MLLDGYWKVKVKGEKDKYSIQIHDLQHLVYIPAIRWAKYYLMESKEMNSYSLNRRICG